ncbi:MAG: hypothetical protein LBH04_08805 [Tannerellaceae bacterium]|nr:hypothetical protein [Tannerellaceae bacterium]
MSTTDNNNIFISTTKHQTSPTRPSASTNNQPKLHKTHTINKQFKHTDTNNHTKTSITTTAITTNLKSCTPDHQSPSPTPSPTIHSKNTSGTLITKTAQNINKKHKNKHLLHTNLRHNTQKSHPAKAHIIYNVYATSPPSTKNSTIPAAPLNHHSAPTPNNLHRSTETNNSPTPLQTYS